MKIDIKINHVLGIAFIIIGLCGIFGTSGCDQPNTQDEPNPVVKKAASKSGIANLRGRYIEFDGHEYVQFTGWGDSSRYFSLAHSPKCSCLVQEGK